MTESPPAEAAEDTPKAAAELAAEGLYAWLSTSDHKVIGRIWIRLSLLLLAAATIIGTVVAFEQTDTTGIDIFGGTNAYVQMWSLYRIGMVLLVVAPLFIGIATVIVPMQVGSTNIAFPRAALAAAWGYVFGALVLVISVIVGGGWGAVDGVSTQEAEAIELTLLGTGIVIGSIMLASVCLATTVISLRTPGMGLAKAPLFAWSMLVTCTVWLFTLPVVIANLIIVTVDLRGGPLAFGNPEGSTQIYEQIAWIVEQPQLYSFALPVLGIIGSIVPVVAQGRHASHAGAMIVIGLAGLLSIGGWSQPFFADGRDDFLFIAFGLVAVVPVLATMGLAGLTLFTGDAPVGIPPAPMAGALGGGLVLLLATTIGALRVIDPLDLIGTTADTAVFSLTVFGAIVGAVAALWFWEPKLNGRELSNLQGLGVVTMFLGAGVLTGVAGLIAGFDETPDDLIGDFGNPTDAMTVIAAIGMILSIAGVLGIVGAGLQSLRGGATGADDPWNGHTLEWATATPVPTDNFAGPLARVTSEAPLLDAPADADGEDS
ncbi:MAG: cbb3-type cytochrome c oxidase subunit I [Actinomycetota bacterium]